MNQLILKQLNNVFDLTTDLAGSLDEPRYVAGGEGDDTGTVGGLLRKIVGYREGRTQQLGKGGVFEFKCTVDDGSNKLHILQALHNSQKTLINYCHAKNIDERECEIFLQIIEDEARLQGEILCYARNQGW